MKHLGNAVAAACFHRNYYLNHLRCTKILHATKAEHKCREYELQEGRD